MCGAGWQAESEVGQLRFSVNVRSRRRAVADTRAFGQGREGSNACRDEPHPYCAAWYYRGLQPMAGTAFAQESHGHHCQLPLADVPGIGRPYSAELPRAAVTLVAVPFHLKVCLQLNIENRNQANNVAHNCRRIRRIAGLPCCCEFAMGWCDS